MSRESPTDLRFVSFWWNGERYAYRSAVTFKGVDVERTNTETKPLRIAQQSHGAIKGIRHDHGKSNVLISMRRFVWHHLHLHSPLILSRLVAKNVLFIR